MGENQVRAEAQVGVMQLQVQEHQGLLAPIGIRAETEWIVPRQQPAVGINPTITLILALCKGISFCSF
jgi:hypothetical protein